MRFFVDQLHLVSRIVQGKHLVTKSLIVVILIAFDEAVHHHAAIKIKIGFQAFPSRSHKREIEVNHLERVFQRCGMFVYPKSVEQPVELIRLRDVIISLHHTDEHALAEAARANQEQVITGIFQQRKIHGFIHIIEISVPHFLKARHSVGNTFYCVCHCRMNHKYRAKVRKINEYPR